MCFDIVDSSSILKMVYADQVEHQSSPVTNKTKFFNK